MYEHLTSNDDQIRAKVNVPDALFVCFLGRFTNRSKTLSRSKILKKIFCFVSMPLLTHEAYLCKVWTSGYGRRLTIGRCGFESQHQRHQANCLSLFIKIDTDRKDMKITKNGREWPIYKLKQCWFENISSRLPLLLRNQLAYSNSTALILLSFLNKN